MTGGRASAKRSRAVAGALAWSVALLAGTFAAAFSTRTTLALRSLWVAGIILCLVVIFDLAYSEPESADARPAWRDPVVAAAAALPLGALAGRLWAWVAERAANCSPAAPFGGCGSEKLLVILGAPVAVPAVALLLALLRVRRGMLIGLVGPSMAAGVITIYHSQVAGSPPPGVLLTAGLTAAGFLLAWGAVTTRLPPYARLFVVTLALAAIPAAQLLES